MRLRGSPVIGAPFVLRLVFSTFCHSKMSGCHISGTARPRGTKQPTDIRSFFRRAQDRFFRCRLNIGHLPPVKVDRVLYLATFIVSTERIMQGIPGQNQDLSCRLAAIARSKRYRQREKRRFTAFLRNTERSGSYTVPPCVYDEKIMNFRNIYCVWINPVVCCMKTTTR